MKLYSTKKNAVAATALLALTPFFIFILLSSAAAASVSFAQAPFEPTSTTTPELKIVVNEEETTRLVPIAGVKKTRGFLFTGSVQGEAARYARLSPALFSGNTDFLLVVNAKKFVEKGSFDAVKGVLAIKEFSPWSMEEQIIRVPLRLEVSGSVGVPAKAKYTSGWIISKGYSHHGIDYFNKVGTPITAVYGGVVDWVSDVDLYDRGKGIKTETCGKGVGIKQEGMLTGYRIVYCHLKDVKVKIGEKVSKCQEIGIMGKTGNAWNTPAHLHFELKKISLNPPDGERINPAPLFNKGSVNCAVAKTNDDQAKASDAKASVPKSKA